MKLTRKLIPAFAMLLVAAVMMTTASFAWFSMNGSVVTGNMNVTATTPASLEITNEIKDPVTDTVWDYSADAKNTTGTKLLPVTWYEDTVTAGAKSGWYIPSGDNKISVDGDAPIDIDNDSIAAGNWTKVNTSTPTDISAEYALVNTFYLRTNVGSASGSAIEFTATASVDGGNLEGGVKVYVYGETADGTTKMVDITAGTTETWEAPTSGNIALTVIIIYDGEVHTVVNNNNADTTATVVSVNFLDE